MPDPNEPIHRLCIVLSQAELDVVEQTAKHIDAVSGNRSQAIRQLIRLAGGLSTPLANMTPTASQEPPNRTEANEAARSR